MHVGSGSVLLDDTSPTALHDGPVEIIPDDPKRPIADGLSDLVAPREVDKPGVGPGLRREANRERAATGCAVATGGAL